MATKKPTPPKVIAGVALPRYTLADVEALHMLSQGTAEAEQQKRALRWIVEAAAATHQWGFYAGQRETDIALGRQFVGQQIIGLLKLNLSDLRRAGNVET